MSIRERLAFWRRREGEEYNFVKEQLKLAIPSLIAMLVWLFFLLALFVMGERLLMAVVFMFGLMIFVGGVLGYRDHVRNFIGSGQKWFSSLTVTDEEGYEETGFQNFLREKPRLIWDPTGAINQRKVKLNENPGEVELVDKTGRVQVFKMPALVDKEGKERKPTEDERKRWSGDLEKILKAYESDYWLFLGKWGWAEKLKGIRFNWCGFICPEDFDITFEDTPGMLIYYGALWGRSKASRASLKALIWVETVLEGQTVWLPICKVMDSPWHARQPEATVSLFNPKLVDAYSFIELVHSGELKATHLELASHKTELAEIYEKVLPRAREAGKAEVETLVDITQDLEAVYKIFHPRNIAKYVIACTFLGIVIYLIWRFYLR